MEINASDTRNRADTKITGGIGGKLANAIKEMATNRAINLDPSGGKKRVKTLCFPLAPNTTSTDCCVNLVPVAVGLY